MVYSRYYRFKLAKDEKIVYDDIVDGITQLKSQVVTSSLAHKDWNKIMYAVRFDNPQFYYVDFSGVSAATSEVQGFINMKYIYGDEKIKQIDALVEKEVKGLLERLKGVEGAKAYLIIHDWLVERIIYGEIKKRPYAAHNILGALLDHKCVCEGFAKAYKYICDLAKLRCVVVVGRAIHPDGTSGGHAWNLIKFNNACYHVDVTFDRMIGGKYYSRAYFMLSTKEVLYDHEIDQRIAIPDCPNSGSSLKMVKGTKELIQCLKEESAKGLECSEIRLSKGFPMDELMDMIEKNITPLDFVWYKKLKSYWYSDYSKTLVITWK